MKRNPTREGQKIPKRLTLVKVAASIRLPCERELARIQRGASVDWWVVSAYGLRYWIPASAGMTTGSEGGD